MSYLFDSSSIFDALLREQVKVLKGQFTVDLARYELGNILWKEQALRRTMDAVRMPRLLSIAKRTLSIMNLLPVACREEEIVKLAVRFNVTFYDASYLFLAKDHSLILITEDRNLAHRARGFVQTRELNSLSS